MTSPHRLSPHVSPYHQGGKTPLHLACQEGHTKTALEVIAKGADMHTKSNVSPCLTLTLISFPSFIFPLYSHPFFAVQTAAVPSAAPAVAATAAPSSFPSTITAAEVPKPTPAPVQS